MHVCVSCNYRACEKLRTELSGTLAAFSEQKQYVSVDPGVRVFFFIYFLFEKQVFCVCLCRSY